MVSLLVELEASLQLMDRQLMLALRLVREQLVFELYIVMKKHGRHQLRLTVGTQHTRTNYISNGGQMLTKHVW